MESIAQNRVSDHNNVSNHNRPFVATEQEQDYWSNEFGISKDELSAAIKAGESYTTAVEKYVKMMDFTDIWVIVASVPVLRGRRL